MNYLDHDGRPMMRERGLVVQEASDELLVYDLDTNKAHCLNSTAAAVWKLCDGTRSIEDISRHFVSLSDDKLAEDLVWLAVDQLADSDLLQNATANRRFAGMSRRKALKSIGLTAAITLPVVASLVAPQNALAVGSCSCVVPADCAVQTTCPSAVNCNGAGVCST